MTLGKLLGTKDFTDRYSEYHHTPMHEQHVYYAYEQPHHAHATSKHSHYNSGKKSNAAMSALTLLAFLFFLHILQQCLKEHMQSLNTPQIMIMSAREGEEPLPKTQSHYKKIDKTGKNPDKVNPAKAVENKPAMTKIRIAEHRPKTQEQYNNIVQRYRNMSHGYDSE